MAQDAAPTPSPEVSDAIQGHRALLLQTQPWLILLGGFSAVSATTAGLAALVTGGIAMFGVAAGGLADMMVAAGLVGGTLGALAAVNAVNASIYAGFAYFLFKQSQAIARFGQTTNLTTLEDVLRAHRDLWRLAGVTLLGSIALYGGAFGLVLLLSALATPSS